MNGICNAPNTCTCLSGWTGTSCSECDGTHFPYNSTYCEPCPNCGSNGVCNGGANGNGDCICYSGYQTPSNSSNYCSQCSDGYYLSGNTCVPCNSTCATCSQPNSCLTYSFFFSLFLLFLLFLFFIFIFNNEIK